MNENDIYAMGFVDYASSIGISPSSLIGIFMSKSAEDGKKENEIQRLVDRTGQGIEPYGPFGSTVMGLVPSIVSSVSIPTKVLSSIGSIAGGIEGVMSEDSNLKGNSLIPGVSQSKQWKRARKTIESALSNDRGTKAVMNATTEALSPVSTIAPALAGAALGHFLGSSAAKKRGDTGSEAKRDSIAGAILGGSAGFAIPQIISMLIASSKKRRSVDEQSEHDSTGHAVENLLVPGYGEYNFWKRQGSSRNLIPEEDDSPEEKIRKLKLLDSINKSLDKKNA